MILFTVFAISGLHRCTQEGGGGGGFETGKLKKKLVYKNAMKPKIGGPPMAIFPESIDPPLGISAKTSSTPAPPPPPHKNPGQQNIGETIKKEKKII